MSELNTGRTYAPIHELVTTADGKCPDGYIEVETYLEAPMLRDLLSRQILTSEHRANVINSQTEEILELKNAIVHARNFILATAHQDNCGPNDCRCGKDRMLAFLASPSSDATNV